METKNIEKYDKNGILTILVNFAPTLKALFAKDVIVSISDREKVIYAGSSNVSSSSDMVGRSLTEQDPMLHVMRSKKEKVLQVPEEVYGIPLKIMIAPILSENGVVIGCISVSYSVHDQENLIRVAEQFAATSEEISASTEELGSSANDLMTFMKHLEESQHEMSQQVESSSKILGMINAVAKNTRILGLNAGIEAARSGEHGKGFGVVAKEITKLADQSAHSVNDINNLLYQLKEKVEHIETIVNETVEVSTSQSSSIEEISKAIHHLATVADDIEDLANRI